MLVLKEIIAFSLIPFLVTAIVSSGNEGVSDFYERSYDRLSPLEKEIQYLINTKRSVLGIKNLIDELHNRLEKRTACALDGGFSASCNHKDAVEAGDHHRFLASSFAPGRRKRRNLSSTPEDYKLYEIIDNNK